MSNDTTATQNTDYEGLRQEGIAWLEKLAGNGWTDFNAHDPGITILEQVCYAFTDLIYRIGYNIEDLLSREGEDTYDSLYSPEKILVSKPVTLLDLRKRVIDVDGVKNAWIEAVPESQPPLSYQENPVLDTDNQVINLTGGDGADALALKGLYRVLIEKSEALDKDSNVIVRDVAERLHGQRSLAVDFDSIQVIDTQAVQVQASIEIDLTANPNDIYLSILEKIDAYFSPAVRFYTLEERMAQGHPTDDIFDGPLLDHGFIDNQELISLKRKSNLYVSDLIREIMDVSGVRLVEFVVFKDGDDFNDTVLVVKTDKIPKLDVYNCKFTLKKKQLRLQLDAQMLAASYYGDQKKPLQRTVPYLKWPLPQGRDRDVGRYYPLLQQFPIVYGVGVSGLSGTASEQRKAQAKQLKAYLLFFDQLLANSFTQLDNFKDLFSFYYKLPIDAKSPTSYFAAFLDYPGISELWAEQDSGARQQRLQEIFGVSQAGAPDAQQAADWRRKNRFVDHLLARFAEQFIDYSHFTACADRNGEVLDSKLTLLQTYDQISSAKGTGFNVLGTGTDNRSGLERMLWLKLGLSKVDEERLYVLEHALLRPMAGDTLQQGSLLINALSSDPYSLQLSVVFFVTADRSDGFKRFAEQIVREETPAHLVVYVCWKDLADRADFAGVYQNWRQQHLAYRSLTDQRILNGPIGQSASIPLRDARDQLIDFLAMGNTYPLRDLAIADIGTVVYGMTAKIVIKNSQQGVSYRLCDDQQKPLQPTIEGKGNGVDLELISPAIQNDISFSIQATKSGNSLAAFLLQTPTVKVGLDLGLVATIDAPLLLGSPKPAANDARIVDYGVIIQAAIDLTQEGVDYQLVRIDGTIETVLSKAVRGDGKTIILQTDDSVTEDFDIRVRATKTFDPSEGKATQTNLLATVLPLKVRANPAVCVTVVTTIIDYLGVTGIKIKSSQASASYQMLARGIADNEFIHGGTTGNELAIAVPNQKNVALLIPTTIDFAVVGDPVQGNGGDLVLTSPNLAADSFIAVRAKKNHLANTGEIVVSTVDVTQITAVLVRPDANPPLHFQANIANSLLQAPIKVTGGQAGVFYEFTTKADNKVQGLPVYFHQLDHQDNAQNKGIGQLQIEVDMALSPNLPEETLKTNPNLAVMAPQTPELSDNASIKSNVKLSIRAIKAQSLVEVVFKRTVGELLS